MKILIGVTGSVATYKACELVRRFQENGCNVKVIMTDSAQEFVGKVTFESILNEKVYTNMFGSDVSGNIHIDLARWADVLVVAPATANIISKFAYGLADDFLSTTYLAFQGMVFIAPAMNTVMWEEKSTQANIQTLKNKKNFFIEPHSGELACKEIGMGKMEEPDAICKFVLNTYRGNSKLQNKIIVITAGPTREYFDPVRFLSSPSSGKMGLAIAKEAYKRGAKVTVIHGPIQNADSFLGSKVSVTSANEMMDSVKKNTPCDIFVSCAAVADYRFEEILSSKFKKGQHELTMKLVPNPDIVAYVSKEKKYKDMVIGFAAETNDVKENAIKKLRDKHLNWIVANQVAYEKQGFEKETTTTWMMNGKDTLEFGSVTKTEFAKQFWNTIEQNLSVK
jgi:phosphopantothenoylcysteine decarboxylase/phosphopantothenate--cysteine ligase